MRYLNVVRYLTFLRIDQAEPGVQHYPAQEK